jgi:hypothetical protein
MGAVNGGGANLDLSLIARNANVATLATGMIIGAPTGGDKGAGTLNVASGIYANNVLLGSGGGLTPIERKASTTDVATLNFLTGINSTYRTYILDGWMQPATDDVELWLRVSDDGSTFEADAGDYSYSSLGNDGGGTNRTKGSTSDVAIKMTTGDASQAVGNAASERIRFTIKINAPSEALPTLFNYQIVWLNPSTAHIQNTGGGFSKASAAVVGLQLLFESGDASAYDVTLYGVANA